MEIYRHRCLQCGAHILDFQAPCFVVLIHISRRVMSRVFKPSRHGTDIQMGKNICDVCRAVVLTSSSPPLFADTVDLYVSPKKRVKVIDFNPWGAATLPLLFTWEELEEIYQSRGVNHDVGAVSETVRTSRRDFSVEGTNEGFECNGHTGANGVPPRHESGREVVFRVVEGGGEYNWVWELLVEFR